MALTGQLSDMSLAELIEFFCNQRKTGRLKIDYPRGHSVFFIKDGELVDARVGALSGAEAVYFSLTLPNAAFDFSPEVQPTRRTIEESWTRVVLEGLRRLDEGLSPTEADAFGNWTPNEAEMAQMFDQIDRLGEQSKGANSSDADGETDDPAPFSMMVEGASAEGGKKKWMVAGVAASLVLVCAVVAIPLAGRFGKSSANTAAGPAPVERPAESAAAPAPSEAAPGAPSGDAAAPSAATNAADDASAAAAEAAKRERERKERERKERERKADEAKRSEAAEAAKPAPTPAQQAGPKSVRVSVSYDEAGRVTQASVAGASPGAEGYGATAVRIARGRRFPAGKAGSTVVTIPVN